MINETFWPDAAAFLDLSDANQIAAGKAHCTAVAVCDSDGNAKRVFEQGQTAHFFYEFELHEDTAAVGGGLEFCDASGRCIHGKNTYQYGTALPDLVQAGTRLRFHHVLQLELAPGQYYFSVGLAAVDPQIYDQYRQGKVGEAVFSPTLRELCRVVNAGSFQVFMDIASKLTHHGLANLPGSCDFNALPPPAQKTADDPGSTPRRWSASKIKQFLPFSRQVAAPASAPDVPAAPAVQIDRGQEELPTVFHVTHWKAGSQWIFKILDGLVRERMIMPQDAGAQFLRWPIQPAKVYPTVYATKQQFDTVSLPANWRRFVVIRDLRDTLISAYFSLKVSHPDSPYNTPYRIQLNSLSMDMGLLLLMEEWLPMCARIQLSWLESGERVIRYEDLLEHDLDILEPLLLDECRLPVSRERLREVVVAKRFERLTRGRARGQEDITAHERKGVSGDWRNHFSEKLKGMFKTRYGGILVAAGYEPDMNW